MLNLGLGALVKQEASAEELSYDYLDTVMLYNEACEELTIVCDQFDQICVAYENLIAISEVIREHGVTPALESLVGGNFANGLTLEASMEAEKGALEKIKDFLVKVWEAIKNFFTRFFTSTFGLNARLENRIKELEAAKEIVIHSFKGLDVIGDGQSVDVAKVFYGGISEATGALQENPDVSEPELKEQNLTKDNAVKYGKTLLALLKKAANAKSNLEKTLDDNIKKAKELKEDSKEAVETLKKEAKAAREIIVPWAKAMHTTAAGYLTHVHAGKDEAKPADDAAKNEGK